MAEVTGEKQRIANCAPGYAGVGSAIGMWQATASTRHEGRGEHAEETGCFAKVVRAITAWSRRAGRLPGAQERMRARTIMMEDVSDDAAMRVVGSGLWSN
jgi:hypothetical protein